ncbi:hypothetical protein D1P53_004218 [Cryptococcus gattii VGV]|nr:hypothetical protein D1P53_004218 [Cryptococcus gattii VGV]
MGKLAPLTLNWGIISTGDISTNFAHHLPIDPTSRNTRDVNHKNADVGSLSVQFAQTFIEKLRKLTTYEEVYSDPDVTVVYVGALHVLHHRNPKDALLAGKHVLLQKPACLEVKELDELSKIAKEKNLLYGVGHLSPLFICPYLYLPLSPNAVEEVIKSDILGKSRSFSADFSMDVKLDASADSNRMINLALGGGSLLDMSAHPSVWAMFLVHRHPLNTDKNPNVLFTHQSIYPGSGVDINSRWLVKWKGLSGNVDDRFG